MENTPIYYPRVASSTSSVPYSSGSTNNSNNSNGIYNLPEYMTDGSTVMTYTGTPSETLAETTKNSHVLPSAYSTHSTYMPIQMNNANQMNQMNQISSTSEIINPRMFALLSAQVSNLQREVSDLRDEIGRMKKSIGRMQSSSSGIGIPETTIIPSKPGKVNKSSKSDKKSKKSKYDCCTGLD